MIRKQTKLKIVDNSGAKLIRIFHLFGYSLIQNYSKVGELVLGSIFRYRVGRKVQKKQRCLALIVTVKRNISRKNGIRIRFDETRGIVLSETKKLLGTRVFGPALKEIRCGLFMRLASVVSKLV
uniref:1cd888ee-32ab-4fa2-859f-e5b088af3f67-CDS n=1 Tax=Plasmodiophora brassicae TaxID=37360 RepID=A0A3P3YWF1_PLABS|nr:1cd888ee-32ab-4fa2-859f-e5b088af3f67-CDS [Plasmodiophora brassicae]